MRRLLIATALGIAFSTQVLAADADVATAPAHTIAPATITAAVNAATTAASADFAARSPRNFDRPAMLPALYTASALLQGYDTYSTLSALKNGGREANPFMKSVTKSPIGFVAMKAGVTTASIMAAERLWKNHHRAGAIGLMIASNVMMGMVAAHNTKVLSTLR